MQDLADWRLIHAWQWYTSASPGPTQLQESWEMSLEAWEEQEKEYVEHQLGLAHLAPLPL